MDQALQDRIEELVSKLTPATVAGGLAKIVVKYSVKSVVTITVYAYVPTSSKKQKLQVVVASWALGRWLGDAASQWAEQWVRETTEHLIVFVKELNEKRSLRKNTTI